MLEHLTNLTPIKVKFKWIYFEQKLFEEIKRVVARKNILSYPNFNKLFEIHTNASDFQ